MGLGLALRIILIIQIPPELEIFLSMLDFFMLFISIFSILVKLSIIWYVTLSLGG